MTKKSLMIASAIILPLTVGVMAMGIGAGNKFNDHLVVGSNAINGTITFSASSSVLENGDLITAGKTNTGGDIYCKTTNNASSGGTNVVAAFKSGTVIRFYEDAECTLEYTFEDIDQVIIAKTNTTSYYGGVLHAYKVDGTTKDYTWSSKSTSPRTGTFDVTPSHFWFECNSATSNPMVSELQLKYTCTPKVLESVSITTLPTKISYLAGERFDKTGMVVKANYTNDISVATTSYSVLPDRPLTIEDTFVTISFKGFTTTQAITVSENDYVGTYTDTASANVTRTLILNNDMTGSFTYIRSDYHDYDATLTFNWTISASTFTFTRTGGDIPSTAGGTSRYIFAGSGDYENTNTGTLSGNNINIKMCSYSGFRSSTNTLFVKQ